MLIRLVALEIERFSSWVERSQREYAADLVQTGLSPEDAMHQAVGSFASEFPSGAPTPDNAVFDLIDDAGANVGYLWVGRDTSGDPASWWVWDIVIDPGSRGRGLGRQCMLLAEEYARSRGATTIGLSVFGFNRAARGLYESLGYETTSVKMRKRLEEPRQ